MYLLVVLVLAGCATAPPPVPAPLLPYASVAGFLLPGFHTVAMGTDEHQPGGGKARRDLRWALCGSEFEPPKAADVGRFRGVYVEDHGPGGLSGVRPKGDPVHPCGEFAVWRDRHEGRGSVLDCFVAHVGDRFVVESHDHELLERALARRGDLATLLAPFAAVRLLPADADGVVCLQVRPGDETYWGRPVPVETTVVSTSGNRVTLLHRESLPRQFLPTEFAIGPPSTTSRDGWQITQFEWRRESEMEWQLWMMMLMGFAIFI